MNTPARRRPRRRTKLAVLVGLIVPSTIVDMLDARAADLPETRVLIIGQAYRLVSDTRLKAYCEGCDPKQSRVIDHANLVVDFIAQATDETIHLKIAGNAIFVPPVTGILKNPRFDFNDIPQTVKDFMDKHDCKLINGEVLDFKAVPN